jgi:hypothetical protein
MGIDEKALSKKCHEIMLNRRSPEKEVFTTQGTHLPGTNRLLWLTSVGSRRFGDAGEIQSRVARSQSRINFEG